MLTISPIATPNPAAQTGQNTQLVPSAHQLPGWPKEGPVCAEEPDAQGDSRATVFTVPGSTLSVQPSL